MGDKTVSFGWGYMWHRKILFKNILRFWLQCFFHSYQDIKIHYLRLVSLCVVMSYENLKPINQKFFGKIIIGKGRSFGISCTMFCSLYSLQQYPDKTKTTKLSEKLTFLSREHLVAASSDLKKSPFF